MLDEIDAIGIARGTKNDSGEIARITISLMQGLDLLQNDVLLLGATNRLDALDKALVRRFSHKHEVTPLEVGEVKEFVSKFLNSVPISFSQEEVNCFCEAAPRQQSELFNCLTHLVIEKIEKEMAAQKE